MTVHLDSRVGDMNPPSWWGSGKALEKHVGWKIFLWLSLKKKNLPHLICDLELASWDGSFLICKIKRWSRNNEFQTSSCTGSIEELAACSESWASSEVFEKGTQVTAFLSLRYNEPIRLILENHSIMWPSNISACCKNVDSSIKGRQRT